MPDFVTDIWNTVFFNPMLNGLVILYGLSFKDLGVTIAVFTVIIRILMLPLTLRQLHSTKAMSQMQPKLAAIQKRYANDKQKLAQEQMRLYKEAGINPLGCLGPMVIQFPIWIGLYQSILLALASTPESLISLSKHLYSWLPQVHELVPLNSQFLWLDLGQPDPVYAIPVLVAGSMWVQQKMSTMPGGDERQAQMNQTMQYTMPLMFGFMTLQFASGLAIYWFISNVISIVIQYFVTGWGSLTWFSRGGGANPGSAVSAGPSDEPPDAPDAAEGAADEASTQPRTSNGKPGSKRKDRRRSR